MKNVLVYGFLGLIILGLPAGIIYYVSSFFPSLNIIEIFMLWLWVTGAVVMIILVVASTFFPKWLRGEFSNRNPWGA